jgi:UDP-2,3-diacylglucosamine pyrophosphatase LpxH
MSEKHPRIERRANRIIDPDSGEDAGVLKYRTIWISDIHLGTHGCQADQMIDFLKHTESDFLYLVGDIVDGWQLRKRWYWPQKHNDVVQKIMRRARKGAKVFFLPGNHDEAARDFCGLYFGGVYVADEAIHVTAAGKRLMVLHGDKYDAVMTYAKWLAKLGDAAYTFALSVNTWFNYIRRKLGFSYWSLSAYLKNRVKNAVEYIGSYEKFIAEEARRHHVDGVVCGHIHYAEMRMIDSVLYANDGDWVESCTALVEDFDGNLSIVNWVKDKKRLLEAYEKQGELV